MEFKDQLALSRLRDKLAIETEVSYAATAHEVDGACGIARRAYDDNHGSPSPGHLLTLITQRRGPFYEFRCTGCDWNKTVTALAASAEPRT